MIYIGCSGWSYPEWKGIFYTGTGDMFRQYATYFNAVEINSTFYQMPSEEIVTAWIKKARPLKHFRFSVKMWSEITHHHMMSNPGAAIGDLERFMSTVIEPLKRENLLSACLVQLPPYFKRSDMESLTSLLEQARTTEVSYSVEFRHPTLYGDTTAIEELAAINVSTVSIDSPASLIRKIYTAGSVAYVRLHGRNYETWKTAEGMEKYLYRYSKAEITEIAELIRSTGTTSDLLIFFNNHPQGNAPLNALELMGALGVNRPSDSSQQRLF